MTTAQTIVSRARGTLIDTSSVTWSDADLTGYLNAGISQACGTLLDLYVLAAVTALVPGVRQALPAGGIVLFDVLRNGLGNSVTQTTVAEFSKTKPSWAADAASTDVRYFFFDKRAPASYLVYPAAAAGTTVELLYAAVPPVIALADTIPISPAFDTALWNYVLGMAYAKNTRRQDLDKTKTYMSLFMSVLETWKKGTTEMVKLADPQGVF